MTAFHGQHIHQAEGQVLLCPVRLRPIVGRREYEIPLGRDFPQASWKIHVACDQRLLRFVQLGGHRGHAVELPFRLRGRDPDLVPDDEAADIRARRERLDGVKVLYEED